LPAGPGFPDEIGGQSGWLGEKKSREREREDGQAAEK
jgi:hypothetical protein